MRPHHVMIGLAVVLLASTIAALADMQPAAGDLPDLSGTWQIDRDASDPPRGLAGAEGGGRPPGGGPGMGGPGMGGPGSRPPGGGMGGFGGPGGGQGMGASRQPLSEEEMKRRRELMRELTTPPARLTIAQDATKVTFIDEHARARAYSTDGRSEKHQFTNATVETHTRWRDAALTIESSLEGGMKIVRRYQLAADPRQLVVTTRLTGGPSRGDAPPEMKTVYVPVEE